MFLKQVIVVALVTMGLADVDFPKIPYVRRFKGPSLDDLIKQQEEFKRQNEVHNWRYERHGP